MHIHGLGSAVFNAIVSLCCTLLCIVSLFFWSTVFGMIFVRYACACCSAHIQFAAQVWVLFAVAYLQISAGNVSAASGHLCFCVSV